MSDTAPSMDLAQARHCTAHNRHGQPCGRYVPPGHVVCASHGAKTSEAQESARRRLLAAVEPALARLAQICADPRAADEVAVKAAGMILDRAGFGPVSRSITASFCAPGPMAFAEVLDAMGTGADGDDGGGDRLGDEVLAARVARLEAGQLVTLRLLQQIAGGSGDDEHDDAQEQT